MKKITFFICIGLLILSSCSDELTRDKAEKILTETFNYPYVEFHQFGVQERKSQVGLLSIENELADLGLVDRVIVDRVYVPGHGWSPFLEQSFSNEAMKYIKLNTSLDKEIKSLRGRSERYLTGYFAVGTKYIKEVTGIQFNEDKTKATVEYSTYRVNFTPFSNIPSYDRWRNEPENESIEFYLYDDGWRVNPDEVN